MDFDPAFVVQSETELDEMYGEPLERSVKKQLTQLDDLCRRFIAASPMVLVGTQGDGTADVSPRGDAPIPARALRRCP